MTRQKNKILTFFFSLIPGAGQMYLGFMKRGLSLIMYIVAIGCAVAILTMEELLILIPPVWMYAFFDAVNLNSADKEYFETVKDDYITFDLLPGFRTPSFSYESKKLWGKGLIIVGFTFLGYNALNILGEFAYNLGFSAVGFFINDILRYAPRFIISVILIISGKYLISGNRKNNSDMVNFTIFVDDHSKSDVTPEDIVNEAHEPEYVVETEDKEEENE